MAQDINVCVFTGRLTRDPELRTASSGREIAVFSLAVNDRKRDRDTGEWQDKPNFLDFKWFGDNLGNRVEAMRKGMKLTVVSRADWSKYETRDGKSATKVEFIVQTVAFPDRQRDDAETEPQLYAADIPF